MQPHRLGLTPASPCGCGLVFSFKIPIDKTVKWEFKIGYCVRELDTFGTQAAGGATVLKATGNGHCISFQSDEHNLKLAYYC